MLCNSHCVCFPSKHLPPKLECRFESWWRLEFLGFSRAFSEAHCRGFFPLLHRLIVSGNEVKTEINGISTLSDIIVELSLCTVYNTFCA